MPSGSSLALALPPEELDQLVAWISDASHDELKEWRGPPPLNFVHDRSVDQLCDFEADVSLVLSKSTERSKKETIGILKTDRDDDRKWAAWLFEMSVKARLLRAPGARTELDHPVNGRDVDVQLRMGHKTYCLECTVLTDSDEDIRAFQRLRASGRPMLRAGSPNRPGSRSPSPYYDAMRLYAKVFEKLAKDLKPRKCQLRRDAPNLLLVCIHCPCSPWVSPDDPGIHWGIDELFRAQPSAVPMMKTLAKLTSPGRLLTDISLPRWLDHTALERAARPRFSLASYYGNYQDLLLAPSKIGAIIIFAGFEPACHRLNNNAHTQCAVSESEIAEMKRLLGHLPSWCLPADD